MSGIDPNRSGVLVVGGGSSLPAASGANEIPVSSGAGTTYVATAAAGVQDAIGLGLDATGSALHRWVLGEGTGTSFADTGSGAEALTLTGAAARVTAPGIRGSGVYFDGTATNYLRSADSPATPTATSFSVDGWVRLTSYGASTYGLLINKPVDTATWTGAYVGMQLTLSNSNDGSWNYAHSAGGVLVSTNVTADQYRLRLGVWHHVAMTYDNATVRVYLDGVLASSVAATGSVSWGTGPWQLGGNANSSDSWLFGALSDWRVQTGVLTAAQITTRYQRGQRRYP